MRARAQTPGIRGNRNRCSRLSKLSDSENRSKISDGPVSNRPPQSFIGLAQKHQQERLLRMQPVFRLIEDDRVGAFHHFVGNFFAAFGREAVHKCRMRLRFRQESLD